MGSLRVVGPGRAGGALARALGDRGWSVRPPVRRGEPLAGAARDTDLLVIATPDAVIGEVAGAITPSATTVVAHLAGSVGLDVLAGHPRRGALHPLVPLPDPELGARLLVGATFAIAGDGLVREVVDALGGTSLEVPDEHRAAYHAAACIASNHLVGLLAHAGRVAAAAHLPLEAYLGLVRATVDNVERLGPVAALTGPAARGDWHTIARHRAAVPGDELAAYDAMVAVTAALAGRPVPAEVAG